MNSELKFINYVRQLSNSKNKNLIESIITGFKVIAESTGSPIVENSDDCNVNTGDCEDAISDGTTSDASKPNESSDTQNVPETPTMIESETELKEVEQPAKPKEEPEVTEKTEIVKSETAAPELVNKVKSLCTEVLGLYKHLTGEEFTQEATETESKEDSKEESKESVNVEPTESPAPMMEEISITGRNAVNDYTQTDYSKAFNQLYSTMDMVEGLADNIYRINKVEPQDQIIKNTVPLIDKILNTYMAEFEHLEQEHMENYIEVIRSNIANSVANWLHTLKALEVSVNQQHSMQGLTGRNVVAKFITDVYQPATDYSSMIRELFATGDAKLSGDKLIANLKAITEKISALVSKFKTDVQADIKQQTGGKAYTKTTSETPASAVPA